MEPVLSVFFRVMMPLPPRPLVSRENCRSNRAPVGLGERGVIEAPIVVNAAGPWSTALNRLAGVGEEFTVSVAPLRQEVHNVPLPDPLRALSPAVPILADMDLGTYIRPDSDHGLLIGGTEPIEAQLIGTRAGLPAQAQPLVAGRREGAEARRVIN